MKQIEYLILCVLLCVLLCSCGALFEPDSTQPEANTNHEITSKPTETTLFSIPQENLLATFTDPETQKDMDYYLFIPSNATEHMPLVVYLHGLGTAEAPKLNETNPMYTNALENYGEEFPFFILAPSSMYKKTWISDSMPQRVKALIDHIVAEYHIDQDKIIIAGHSMGASGVFRQIELYGDFYSAALPVSVPDVSIIEKEKCLNVPIWGFAGSKEGPWNYNMEQTLNAIAEMGGNTRYVEIEDADHGEAQYMAFLWNVMEWAIDQ